MEEVDVAGGYATAAYLRSSWFNSLSDISDPSFPENLRYEPVSDKVLALIMTPFICGGAWLTCKVLV